MAVTLVKSPKNVDLDPKLESFSVALLSVVANLALLHLAGLAPHPGGGPTHVLRLIPLLIHS
jgi:hypothetical protein